MAGPFATRAATALPWLFWPLLAVIPFFEGPKNTLFVLAGLAWLGARGWRHDPGPLRWAGWLAVIALLAAITAISPREAFNGAFDYFRIFVCGLFAVAVVRTRRDALVTLAVGAGATALAAAVAMARVALGYANFGSAGLSILSLGFSNQAAAYLVLALVAQLFFLARALAPAAPGRAARWWAVGLPMLALLPTLAALWLTSSRGAWVAAALLLLLLVARHGTRRLVVGLLLLLLLLLPLLHTSMAREQLTNIAGGLRVVGWRAAMWQGCVPLIMAHPWLGVGPRNFTNLDPELYLRGWDYSNHAHNLLVNPAVEMGLPGLGCLLALLVAPLRLARRLPPEWRFLPQGAVLALFVTGIITTTYQTEAGMLFAALLGTAVGIGRLQSATRPV